jgi:hypothetical protein
MSVWAEWLAAAVVALAAAALSVFGVSVESDEAAADRSVRRMPVIASSVTPTPHPAEAALVCEPPLPSPLQAA